MGTFFETQFSLVHEELYFQSDMGHMAVLISVSAAFGLPDLPVCTPVLIDYANRRSWMQSWCQW